MRKKDSGGPLTYEQAKDKALRLLEFKRRSEKELRTKLRLAGAADEDIDEIIAFCRRYKFVDDEEFARLRTADLKNLKKYGKRRIERELYSQGIAADIVQSVLEETDFGGEEDALFPLVRKKLGGDFEKKSADRCIRYFLYRGYEFGDIKRCIERAKEEYEEYEEEYEDGDGE